MNQKNKIVEVYGLWFADLVAIGISYILATYIRFGNFRDMADKGIHFQVCLVFLLFCTIYTFFLDWNRNFLKRSIRKEVSEILKYNVILILTTQTVMYFFKWADVFPRLVMIYFPILNVILTLAIHMLIKKGMRIHYSSEISRIKILVITQRSMASGVLEQLQDSLDINYQIVGIAYLGENEEKASGRAGEGTFKTREIDGVPLMLIGDRFMEEVTRMAVDEVFIYAPELRQKQIRRMLGGFDEMGVDCHYSRVEASWKILVGILLLLIQDSRAAISGC